jgi:hypothetical protein
MEFASDNVVGAHEAILAAVMEANTGAAPSYGYDSWTKQAEAALSKLFETEVVAFLVLTGTAANALALSTICPAYGAVLCHAEAHINTDECGAPEYFMGGSGENRTKCSLFMVLMQSRSRRITQPARYFRMGERCGRVPGRFTDPVHPAP